MYFRRDPQESNPAFRRLLEAAVAEAEAIVQAQGIRDLGACHAIWGETKRILRERHGLSWRTPAEMNPEVMFD